MIILDIETGGLDPQKSALLSIGAVDYTSGDEFYTECRAEAGEELGEIALGINGFTVAQAQDLSKPTKFAAYLTFLDWAKGHDPLIGGQQVGSFDVPFLKAVHDTLFPSSPKWPFGYRSVDLHSVAFAKLGKSLSLDGILEAVGLKPEPKPHHALNGARLEREAFKRLLAA